MNTIDLLNKYGRAQLGIDGNAAFALLGDDLQEGEAEFIDITEPITELNNQIIAAKQAFYKLRDRLNIPELSYYLGKSHPMYL